MNRDFCLLLSTLPARRKAKLVQASHIAPVILEQRDGTVIATLFRDRVHINLTPVLAGMTPRQRAKVRRMAAGNGKTVEGFLRDATRDSLKRLQGIQHPRKRTA